MKGLKRAQIDLDFAPEEYKHFHVNEIPDRYKARVDARRFSSGERTLFLPLQYGDLRRDAGMDSRASHFHRASPAVDYAIAVMS
jgi:hypothetical protein